MIVRTCDQCGDALQRKRYECGKLEQLKDWEKRRFCGERCHRVNRLACSIERAEKQLEDLRRIYRIAVKYGIAA